MRCGFEASGQGVIAKRLSLAARLEGRNFLTTATQPKRSGRKALAGTSPALRAAFYSQRFILDEPARTLLPRLEPASDSSRQLRQRAPTGRGYHATSPSTICNPKRYVWRAQGEKILDKIQRTWKVRLGENNTALLFRRRMSRETRLVRRINGCMYGRAAMVAAYVRNLGLLPTN